MFDTKFPTLSVCTDVLRCLVIVVVTSIFMPGIAIKSALAAAVDTPVSVPPPAQGDAPAVAHEVPAASGIPAFDIYEYVIDGNSRLSGLVIENSLSAFMGKNKTLHDVERARMALERAYHAAGYMSVVVTIPEQRV